MIKRSKCINTCCHSLYSILTYWTHFWGQIAIVPNTNLRLGGRFSRFYFSKALMHWWNSLSTRLQLVYERLLCWSNYNLFIGWALRDCLFPFRGTFWNDAYFQHLIYCYFVISFLCVTIITQYLCIECTSKTYLGFINKLSNVYQGCYLLCYKNSFFQYISYEILNMISWINQT